MSSHSARLKAGLLLTALLFALPSASPSQTCEDYARHFHWLTQVDIPGTLVYLAIRSPYGFMTDEDAGLRILDLTNPVQPVPVGAVALPGHAWDVKLHGDYACVSVFDQGLQVVDIKDPAKPSIAGSVWTSSSIGFDIQDDYLFLADFGSMNVYTISLADPSNPEIVAELRAPSFPWDVAVAGNLAVVTAGYTVMVMDISNPLDPRRLGTVGVPYAAYDVAIERHYAFIAGDGRFFVVDFAEPTHPILVAEIDVRSMNWTVIVKDGFAFLGRQESGVDVFDVRDPTHPVLVAHLLTNGNGWAWGLAIVDDIMYVLDRYGGIHILDVGNPRAVQPIASVDTPGPVPRGIAIAGSYAYIANMEEGLVVVDLSNPTSPRIIAQIDTDGSAWDVAHEGGIVYLADDSRGLKIFDVAVPEAPVLLSAISTGGHAACVAVQHGYAYVANPEGQAGCVVDVHDPMHPQVVGSLPGAAGDIELRNDLAYLASGDLTTVDITDPAHARILSSMDMGFFLRSVTGNEGHLFVGGDRENFRGQFAALSLEDPAQPTLLGTTFTLGSVRQAELHGDYLWLAENELPVQILDVSNPSDPKMIGLIELADYMGDATWDVAIGDHFALGGNGDQLKVLPCHLPLIPASTPSERESAVADHRIALVCSSDQGIHLSFSAKSRCPPGIEIVDLTGRVIRKLALDGAAGASAARFWDGRSTSGRPVAPGVYFARMTTGTRQETKRLIVLP